MSVFVALGSARANAPALHWVRGQGADTCIDPIALAHRVEALTGPVFVSASAADLSIAGDVLAVQSGFAVRIVTSGRDGRLRGTRLLRGTAADCRTLDTAIIFVIALLIDPDLALGADATRLLAAIARDELPGEQLLAELDVSPPVAAKVVAVARPAVPPEPRPEPVPTPPDRRLTLRAAAVLLGRVLPQWATGAQVAVGYAVVPRLTLALLGRIAADVGSDRLPSGGRALFRVYEVAGQLCPQLLAWERLQLHACASGSLGYLAARGIDFDRNHRARVWAPALGASLSPAFYVGRGVSLFGDLGVRLRLTRQGFDFANSSGDMRSAYRPPRAAFVLALGAGYAF